MGHERVRYSLPRCLQRVSVGHSRRAARLSPDHEKGQEPCKASSCPSSSKRFGLQSGSTKNLLALLQILKETAHSTEKDADRPGFDGLAKVGDAAMAQTKLFSNILS